MLHLVSQVEGELAPMMAKGRARGIETRGVSHHGFIDSIYFRDPDGYVIELTCKRDGHDAAMDPAHNGARDKLDRWMADLFEDDPPEMRRLAAELATHFTRVPGVLIEDKGGAVALHYRLAPERADECQGLMRRLAAAYGLDTIMGHCVIEARPTGINKGLGLHRLSETPPFSGRVPIFVGDDTTDEDAILAAQALGTATSPAAEPPVRRTARAQPAAPRRPKSRL